MTLLAKYVMLAVAVKYCFLGSIDYVNHGLNFLLLRETVIKFHAFIRNFWISPTIGFILCQLIR